MKIIFRKYSLCRQKKSLSESKEENHNNNKGK